VQFPDLLALAVPVELEAVADLAEPVGTEHRVAMAKLAKEEKVALEAVDRMEAMDDLEPMDYPLL
jgi:hypothetical protein